MYLIHIKHSDNSRTSNTTNLPRKYDPPPLPLQYSTQTTPYKSPQQVPSNTQTTNTVHFQTPSPTTQLSVPTLAYTPAQNTQTQNIQTALPIDTLHFNAKPKYITSRNLSRPPLQTIPTNPLSDRLISTNQNDTPHSTTKNNNLNTLNPFSTSQQSNI